MKSLSSTTKQRIIIIGSLCVLFLFSFLVWQHLQPTPLASLPNDVSQKLLFTPYMPSRLPKGYILQPTSLAYKDGALFFMAQKRGSSDDVISVSEQAVPKGYNIDSFYESTLSSPTRLHGTRFTTVFGERVGSQGDVAGITTDDQTWIILSSTSTISKDDIKTFVNGLIPQ